MRPTQRLLTADEVLAKAKLLKMPELFMDGGWDGIPREDITLINDGNGQKPFGRLTGETFNDLKARGLLSSNLYRGFKRRAVFAIHLAPPN